MTAEATWLLVGLFAAHFVGDFTPLATARMHEAKAGGGPAGPIFQHAFVHGLLAALTLAALSAASWWTVAAAAGFVLATHFVLDYARARAGHRNRDLGDPSRQTFWVALGADQLAHGLVLIGVTTWVL